MQKPEFRRHDTPDERLERYAGFRGTLALRDWDQQDRYAAADNLRINDPIQAALIEKVRDTLDSALEPYALRRQAERALADYIDKVSCSQFGTLELRGICRAMRECRCKSPVGIKPDGGRIYAWDCKCGYVRLCPDEARAETKRLAAKYVPELIRWVKEKPTRRIYYCVFTSPNFPAGDLLGGKRWQFDAYKQFRKHEYIKGRVLGSLVVQEDPLSVWHDWNVHLNAILCVEGEFDYAKARAAWGHHVYFKEQPRDIAKLTAAVRELVKYSAKHTGTASEEAFVSGKSEAPPMTAWPHARWLEWWHAQRPSRSDGGVSAFRRTRSYGCLNGLKFEPERIDLKSVIWIGSVEYGASGHYVAHLNKAVTLIPEDNFSRNDRQRDNLRGYWRETGPPDPGRQ